ncbi:MAG: hypothetical protein ACKONH_05980 [Planctomycetia bacterium]
MTLEAAPDSRWADAARLNLADALLGAGDVAGAAAILREDVSPRVSTPSQYVASSFICS